MRAVLFRVTHLRGSQTDLILSTCIVTVISHTAELCCSDRYVGLPVNVFFCSCSPIQFNFLFSDHKSLVINLEFTAMFNNCEPRP